MFWESQKRFISTVTSLSDKWNIT